MDTKTGGYKILNFSGVSENALVKFPGIYEQIESSNKVFLVTGVKENETELDDFFTKFEVSGTSFVSTSFGVNIVVRDDDYVTILGTTQPIIIDFFGQDLVQRPLPNYSPLFNAIIRKPYTPIFFCNFNIEGTAFNCGLFQVTNITTNNITGVIQYCDNNLQRFNIQVLIQGGYLVRASIHSIT